MEGLDLKVVGVTFGKRQLLLSELWKFVRSDKKLELKLKREPTNVHDKYAIKVLARASGKWKMVGYISRKKGVNRLLGRVFDHIESVRLKGFRRKPRGNIGIKITLCFKD